VEGDRGEAVTSRRRIRVEPPRIGRWLLGLRALGPRRPEVEGDLAELFALRVDDHGRVRASWRYCRDALSVALRWSAHPSHVSEKRPGGLDGMTQDLVFALRLFRRQMGVVSLTIAGLAIAIAISTVTFSIVNAHLFRGRGFVDPGSLYQVSIDNARWAGLRGRLTPGPSGGTISYTAFAAIARDARTLHVVASGEDHLDIGSELERRIAAVSGGFFRATGGRAFLGRTLTEADDAAGAPPVAVLSHAYWAHALYADRSLVGTTIQLNGAPFAIVGVAEPTFLGVPSSWNEEPPALWIPLQAHAALWREHQGRRAAALRRQIAAEEAGLLGPAARERTPRLRTTLQNLSLDWNLPVAVLGRLTSGATVAQAEAEVQAIAMPFTEPPRGGEQRRPAATRLGPVGGASDEARYGAAVVLCIVTLVVLIACANIANLLLASATARDREISTRLALGASRGRIVRQLVTESLMLGFAGGLAGLLLAIWVTPIIATIAGVSPLIDVSPDVTVYGFALLLILLTGLGAGLAPARYGRRSDLVGPLRSDQIAAASPVPARRLRALLVGGQAALSLVLVATTALFARSAVRVGGFDVGFDIERIFNVSVTLGPGHTETSVGAYWDAAMERVRQVPGVAVAARATVPPFGFSGAAFQVGGREINRNETSAEYFDALGLRVLQGRTYTADEVRRLAPVAVISERVARAYWGEASPIGASLDGVWGEPDAPDAPRRWRPRGTVVIGVVTDIVGSMRRADVGTIYLPLAEHASPGAVQPTLVVHAHTDMGPLRPVTEILQSLDATATLHPVGPAADRRQSDIDISRTFAWLAGIVGLSALGLAVVGLFGVTAFVAARRRQEISLRMILGATQADVTRLLIRDSLRPVAIGLALGLVVALLGGQVIQGMLFGLSARDPVALVAAVTVLIVATVAAALVPIRQATRVEPAEMLKQG
jgi:predicted permease